MMKHGIEGTWRKASYSNASGDCVEVAAVDGVAVGDTKDHQGPALQFGSEAWSAFVSAIKNGELG